MFCKHIVKSSLTQVKSFKLPVHCLWQKLRLYRQESVYGKSCLPFCMCFIIWDELFGCTLASSRCYTFRNGRVFVQFEWLIPCHKFQFQFLLNALTVPLTLIWRSEKTLHSSYNCTAVINICVYYKSSLALRLIDVHYLQ